MCGRKGDTNKGHSRVDVYDRIHHSRMHSKHR